MIKLFPAGKAQTIRQLGQAIGAEHPLVGVFLGAGRRAAGAAGITRAARTGTAGASRHTGHSFLHAGRSLPSSAAGRRMNGTHTQAAPFVYGFSGTAHQTADGVHVLLVGGPNGIVAGGCRQGAFRFGMGSLLLSL